YLAAEKYLREAVRLDPRFALSWALLSYVDARGYITATLQPTVALREEARQAAETALTLQPNLGEALLAKGYYYYACLKDYHTAEKYLREAVRLDPRFALSWALLSYVDARGYITATLQPTVALREEARQAAETALTLQPNLGEALLAKGYYYYACLKDYDTA